LNYVVYNGVNSNTIPGLIIQELPPIIKPKLRTEITEIDGLDGSLIENLGYESYEKILKIGITPEANIDAINWYFSGSGEIVFSNEPEKYYKCSFLESLEYERLVTFKECEVSIYVQPFKYLLDEPIVDITIDTETSIDVTNQGYIESKPIFTFYGSGIIEISINDLAQFQVDLTNIESGSLIVDCEKQDCLDGDGSGTYRNRAMTGVFPTLPNGMNTVTYTGNLTRIIINPKSRWF